MSLLLITLQLLYVSAPVITEGPLRSHSPCTGFVTIHQDGSLPQHRNKSLPHLAVHVHFLGCVCFQKDAQFFKPGADKSYLENFFVSRYHIPLPVNLPDIQLRVCPGFHSQRHSVPRLKMPEGSKTNVLTFVLDSSSLHGTGFLVLRNEGLEHSLAI